MSRRAQEGSVIIGRTTMDYVTFGQGARTLVLIPGLGDGLKTVAGTKFVLARMYRSYAEAFKVYVFSRKNALAPGYSTRDMAQDQKKVLDSLGIRKASIMGISQGGMVAQFLAIDYPKSVEKLVLVVSISRQNGVIQKVIGSWKALAEQGDYQSLVIDSMEKAYSEARLKRYRPAYPVITRLGKPKSLARFIIQAQACLEHDSYAELQQITCPTLIIGGAEDQIVGQQAGPEMAARIENSELFVYEGLGHGAYEEAKDFDGRVLEFLGAGALS